MNVLSFMINNNNRVLILIFDILFTFLYVGLVISCQHFLVYTNIFRKPIFQSKYKLQVSYFFFFHNQIVIAKQS